MSKRKGRFRKPPPDEEMFLKVETDAVDSLGTDDQNTIHILNRHWHVLPATAEMG